MGEIATIRAKIDELDRQIIALAAERTTLARMLLDIKKAKGLPALDEAREREILSRAKDSESREILELMLKISRG
jgi:chorismate mutase